MNLSTAGFLFSMNVSRKRLLFSSRAVFVFSSLHLPSLISWCRDCDLTAPQGAEILFDGAQLSLIKIECFEHRLAPGGMRIQRAQRLNLSWVWWQESHKRLLSVSTWPFASQYFGEWIFSAFKAQRRARSLSYVTRVGTLKAGKSRRPKYAKAIG